MSDRVRGLADWPSERLRPLTSSILELQQGLLADAVAALRQDREQVLARAVRTGAGDVSFALDVPAEERIEQHFVEATELHPIDVVAEGLGSRRFGSTGQADWRVILDPIDGTRQLARSLRSAFSLAGVATNRGPATTLRDIVLAIQTELPVPNQSVASILVAERGRGVVEASWNHAECRYTTGISAVHASRATSVRGSVASLVHPFPGSHRTVGALADDLFRDVLGPVGENEAQVLDDQWCSGGQIWALATGRYAFVADLRGLLPIAGRGLTAHPYDVCTLLAAAEAGAVVTDGRGAEPDYPLDTETACSWIGFANAEVEAEIAPALRRLIETANAG